MYLSLIVTFLYIFFFVLYRNRMKKINLDKIGYAYELGRNSDYFQNLIKMNFSDDEIVAIMIEKRKEFFEKN